MPRYKLLVLVTFAFGVLALGVALAPTLAAALILLVPMGAASVAFIALANSLLQLHSAGQMRGRVMSLWAIVFLGSTPIGAPLTGLVAAHFGARAALSMGAVATLLTAAGAAFAMRRIRAEERRDEASRREHAAAAPTSRRPGPPRDARLGPLRDGRPRRRQPALSRRADVSRAGRRRTSRPLPSPWPRRGRHEGRRERRRR